MDYVLRQGSVIVLAVLLLLVNTPLRAAELADLLEVVRPGVVVVGTMRPVKTANPKNPPVVFKGTGFLVADGRTVVTNLHVVPGELDDENNEKLTVFVGRGQKVTAHSAEVVAKDVEHDLAVLRIQTTLNFKPLKLAKNDMIREGESVFFTGFPLGMVLGLFPVTNQTIISARTPLVIPAISSGTLSAAQIKALRQPFEVYQLDAIAYPGNSGSPVFDGRSGEVVGVVNSVFVKQTKETLLQAPSGITYAIPVRYVNDLLKQVR